MDQDALDLIKETGKVGVSVLELERSAIDLQMILMMTARLLKVKLRTKHGSFYSGVQYAMWADILVGGGHDSMDEPPPAPECPELEGQVCRMHLLYWQDLLLSPLPKEINHNSPTKSVTLRGKYMEQLCDLVHLKEIGALTEEEYQEQRVTIVNL